MVGGRGWRLRLRTRAWPELHKLPADGVIIPRKDATRLRNNLIGIISGPILAINATELKKSSNRHRSIWPESLSPRQRLEVDELNIPDLHLDNPGMGRHILPFRPYMSNIEDVDILGWLALTPSLREIMPHQTTDLVFGPPPNAHLLTGSPTAERTSPT